jgi:DNA end-binding protein Ku
MAVRPTWKGYLKVSLVTIPVRVYPATESSATIAFNQLHAECQTKIQQKKWCPKCEREITSAEVVKGYEFEKGRWVVMDEEDIAKVKTESSKVINLLQFTDADAIDPMYVDKAYYLAPEGPMAADAYSVMREGMQGKAGIGKVAIHGREYLVAVKPHQQGMVMYTLHHAAEIRTIDQIEELREVRGRVNPAEMKLARQVIESIEGDLNLSDYKDEYQEGLRAIIDAKVAGEEFVAPEESAPPKVVDLMEALRKSLDQVSRGKKKTAKADQAETVKKVTNIKSAAKSAARKRKASWDAARVDRTRRGGFLDPPNSRNTPATPSRSPRDPESNRAAPATRTPGWPRPRCRRAPSRVRPARRRSARIPRWAGAACSTPGRCSECGC